MQNYETKSEMKSRMLVGISRIWAQHMDWLARFIPRVMRLKGKFSVFSWYNVCISSVFTIMCKTILHTTIHNYFLMGLDAINILHSKQCSLFCSSQAYSKSYKPQCFSVEYFMWYQVAVGNKDENGHKIYKTFNVHGQYKCDFVEAAFLAGILPLIAGIIPPIAGILPPIAGILPLIAGILPLIACRTLDTKLDDLI